MADDESWKKAMEAAEALQLQPLEGKTATPPEPEVWPYDQTVEPVTQAVVDQAVEAVKPTPDLVSQGQQVDPDAVQFINTRNDVLAPELTTESKTLADAATVPTADIVGMEPSNQVDIFPSTRDDVMGPVTPELVAEARAVLEPTDAIIGPPVDVPDHQLMSPTQISYEVQQPPDISEAGPMIDMDTMPGGVDFVPLAGMGDVAPVFPEQSAAQDFSLPEQVKSFDLDAAMAAMASPALANMDVTQSLGQSNAPSQATEITKDLSIDH